MALSKPSSSYLEEMLTCAVCLEQLREPQTLMQCLHNYCKPCVQQLMASQNNPKPGVNCPACRKFSAENEIRNNHFINDLLGMQISGKLSERNICQQCPEAMQNPAEVKWKCLDCRLSLCNNCKSSHFKIPLLRGHRILPFNEETEMVVDQLVFCKTHVDTPIEFFCNECHQLLCHKCYIVSNHKSHDVVTIDTALSKILPEIEENSLLIDKELENIEKGLNDFDEKILETETAYSSCRDEVDKTAKQYIKAIKDEQKKLHGELLQIEEAEKKKLQEGKEALLGQKKEHQNLQKVVNTSIERARHASLLTELIQGGIYEGVKRTKHGEGKQPRIEIQLPKLKENSELRKSLQQKGSLGQLVYTVMSIAFMLGKSVTNNIISSPRCYSGSFKEFFSKPLKKTVEISLNYWAFRLCITAEKLWVPLKSSNVIHIYSKTGILEKTVNIQTPVSITPNQANGVLVACTSSGLYSISKEGNVSKLADGTYSDIVVFNGKLLAWEHSKNQIVEFQNDVDGKWTEMKKTDMSYVRSNNYYDTLHAFQPQSQSPLEYFIAARDNLSIYHANEEGQLIKQYTHAQEMKIQYPYVCGTDSEGNLLVAEDNKYRYKLLNMKTEQWHEVFMGESNVSDAIMDGDQAVWFAKHNGNNYTVAKYEC